MLIIAHGGAGKKRPERKALKKLGEAIAEGYRVLKSGGASIEAVVEAIAILEDSGLFNAGSGGNLQLDGVRRLDASAMEGSTLRAGSVIGLEGTRNPVKAARLVMDSPHRILTNAGARKIAKVHSLPPLPEPDEKAMRRLEKALAGDNETVRFYKRHFSTVGAVAADKNGDLAAGSSTGGVALMLPGRVGDTPVIGAGIYAENSTGAVSCTGRGEDIIRLVLAKEICMNMREAPVQSAARASLKRILKIGGDAGVIAIGADKKFAIMHTTEHMASGYANKDGIMLKEGFTRIT